jgi:hypothetical protein
MSVKGRLRQAWQEAEKSGDAERTKRAKRAYFRAKKAEKAKKVRKG